jgi:hypothetical protein
LSSLFQRRYAAPSSSTNGLGSIDPARSSWKINGSADSSTKGPAGSEAVATEMAWRPAASYRTA